MSEPTISVASHVMCEEVYPNEELTMLTNKPQKKNSGRLKEEGKRSVVIVHTPRDVTGY